MTRPHHEMNRAMTLPDMREKMNAFGLGVYTEPPEFLAQTIRNDFAQWDKLARDIGFKPR